MAHYIKKNGKYILLKSQKLGSKKKKKSGKSLFAVAAKNKSFKAAKVAAKKAAKRSSMAWKNAIRIAKRQIK